MSVQEADELDPFRGSVVSDEETVLESPGRIQTHLRGGSGGESQNKKKEVYIYPSAGGAGDIGHRRSTSAGTGTGTRVAGTDRMMTSAEMNMKSQFLMNLRPFGEESARSEGSEATGLGASSRSQMAADNEGMLGEEEEAEEEEQLGPGSDFFT